MIQDFLCMYKYSMYLHIYVVFYLEMNFKKIIFNK